MPIGDWTPVEIAGSSFQVRWSEGHLEARGLDLLAERAAALLTSSPSLQLAFHDSLELWLSQVKQCSERYDEWVLAAINFCSLAQTDPVACSHQHLPAPLAAWLVAHHFEECADVLAENPAVRDPAVLDRLAQNGRPAARAHAGDLRCHAGAAGLRPLHQRAHGGRGPSPLAAAGTGLQRPRPRPPRSAPSFRPWIPLDSPARSRRPWC